MHVVDGKEQCLKDQESLTAKCEAIKNLKMAKLLKILVYSKPNILPTMAIQMNIGPTTLFEANTGFFCFSTSHLYHKDHYIDTNAIFLRFHKKRFLLSTSTVHLILINSRV